MGIKGFGSVVRARKGGDYDRYGKLNTYAGRRIGIDASGTFYSKKSTAIGIEVENLTIEDFRINENNVFRSWVDIVVNFMMYFIYSGVIPVIVFDGPNKYMKTDTIGKRMDDRKKNQTRLDELLEIMDSRPIHKRKPEMFAEIKKLYKNITSVSRADIKAIKKIFRKLGFPVCESHGEGEKLAASLYREGYIDAVFSQDSDLYILGCETVITKIAHVNMDSVPPSIGIKYVKLEELLEILEMSFSEMVHFAIMLGCDFNSNIRGVGKVGAEKLIREHHDVYRIDRKTGHDLTILNVDDCMAFFDYTPSDQYSFSIELNMKDIDPSVITLLENMGLEVETIDAIKKMKIIEVDEHKAERTPRKLKRIMPQIIDSDEVIYVESDSPVDKD